MEMALDGDVVLPDVVLPDDELALVPLRASATCWKAVKLRAESSTALMAL